MLEIMHTCRHCHDANDNLFTFNHIMAETVLTEDENNIETNEPNATFDVLEYMRES